MVATDTENKRKAWAKMDQSLNAADRARRAIKSGRKPKTTKPVQKAFDAVQRLMEEADRACGLMRKEGLDPDDIRLTLLYRLADVAIGSKDLPSPSPEAIGEFYESLEKIAASAPVRFLGILWCQIDREIQADGKPLRTYWVTEFADDPRGSLEMLAFKNKLASMSGAN